MSWVHITNIINMSSLHSYYLSTLHILSYYILLFLCYDNYIRMERHLFIVLLFIIVKNVWNILIFIVTPIVLIVIMNDLNSDNISDNSSNYHIMNYRIVYEIVIIAHNIIIMIIIISMETHLYVIYICVTDIIYDLSTHYDHNPHVNISFLLFIYSSYFIILCIIILCYDNYIRRDSHLFILQLWLIVKKVWNYYYPMELMKT